MNKEECRSITYQMIHIIAVALGIDPDYTFQPEACDYHLLSRVAGIHHATVMVAAGLEKMGRLTDEFKVAAAKRTRKSILFDAEYKKLSNELTGAQIHHLPLKGVIIKKLYPKSEMREMADIDILFDKNKSEEVHAIMSANGYQCELYDKSNHDVYIKKPFYNIEMHRELFNGSSFPQLDAYYAEKDFLSRPDGFQCSMSIEDQYIYILSHFYQHYIYTGIGINPLVDLYLYLKQFRDSMDFQYIYKELKKLPLADFEVSVKNLCHRIWSPETLLNEEKKELDYYILSRLSDPKGMYYHNKVSRALNGPNKVSKGKYIRNRLTITDKHIKNSRFYSKHPKLAPFMRATRPIKALLTNSKDIMTELIELKKAK